MPPRIPLPPHLGATPFSLRAAAGAGLSEKRLRGADLQRPYRGVRSAVPLDDHAQRALAYAQHMPEHAFFCSLTAAYLHGIPLPPWLDPPDQLHVGVPSPIRALKERGIRGHKLQIDDGDISYRGALRVSSPERTWCDLGTLLGIPDLVAAADHLIHWRAPVTTVRTLRRQIVLYPGRRGRPALRAAIDLTDARAESPPESRLRVILLQAGMTGWVPNLGIATTSGHSYRADLAHPETKVILEYQGEYHNETNQFRQDMTRRSRLEADRWRVMLVNANDLRNPQELVARIRRFMMHH